MVNLRAAIVLVVLAGSLLMPSGVFAAHDGTCHPPVLPLYPTEELFGAYNVTVNDTTPNLRAGAEVRLQVVAGWGETGSAGEVELTLRGTAHIRDGTSNTVMVAERFGSTATCIDRTETGERELESLNLLFREPRTGASEFVVLRIVHTAESEAAGHPILIQIDDREWHGLMTVRTLRPEPALRGGR